jgi:hypothetical protein
MLPGDAPYTASEAFKDYFTKTGGVIWSGIWDCD